MILNQVTVMGNLVRDPELKYTPAGAAICNMRMAVNDGYYKEAEWTSTPVFIDVAVFGDKGVTAGNLRKGERVIVVGKLRYETSYVCCWRRRPPRSHEHKHACVRVCCSSCCITTQ